MKKFLSIAFMILTLFLVASCQMPGTNPGGNTGGNNGGNGGTPVDPYSGEFGKPVEEDLTTKNILTRQKLRVKAGPVSLICFSVFDTKTGSTCL